jgi:putative membrane protein
LVHGIIITIKANWKSKRGLVMEYMFESGFLGTRAPFFMDFVTLIVAILPMLVAGAISLARAKKYKYHAFLQIFIFAFATIVLVYFEIGVRVGGGFKAFMQGSSVSHDYAFFVLLLHIAIAVVTLLIWSITLLRAKRFLTLGIHKLLGRISFIGIVLTSLSGIWVYLILFVY